MPVGGGYGDPFARDCEAVCDGVRQGLVGREAAERDHGVCLGDDLTLDADATSKSRAATS